MDNQNLDFWQSEMEKCKASPYYFYTKYVLVDGKPFTTNLTEEEFNEEFIKPLILVRGRRGLGYKIINKIKK